MAEEMRVAAILITHSFYPEKLLKSIDASSISVDWLVFFHGHDEDLKSRIGEAVAARNGRFHPYGTDRGLARSWNEGIVAALDDDADLILLLNDDLFFYPGCFEQFVDYCLKVKESGDMSGVVHTNGLESGGSEYAGTVQSQGFACCAILPRALETIGFFDPEFCPCYFEDSDYARRLVLSNLIQAIHPDTLIEHERGLTARLDPALAARTTEIVTRSSAYFVEKWGGVFGTERFDIPFGNAQFDNKIRREDRLDPYKRGLPVS